MHTLVRPIGLVALALGVIAAGSVASPRESRAVIIYQWCASFGGAAGATNCGFATYQQCRQSLGGGGGSCYQNPQYDPPQQAPATTRRPRNQ